MKIGFLFIPLFLTGSALSAEDSSSTSRYIELAAEAINRGNEFLKKNGFPIGSGTQGLVANSKFDPTRKVNIVEVDGGRDAATVRFRKDTQKIVLYQNAISTKLAQYDRPLAATWTNEKALALANGFVSAILLETPVDLGNPTVFYKEQLNYPKYTDGKWRVRWQRVDRKGHVFLRDGLNVSMTERLGPDGFGYNFYSNYQEANFEPILREKALTEAQKPAQEMMACPALKGWFRGYQLDDSKELECELYIVNPNHITELSAMDDLAFAGDPNARLAWVIRYKARYTGPVSDKGTHPASGEVQVWIDAENGKFLGGDCK